MLTKLMRFSDDYSPIGQVNLILHYANERWDETNYSRIVIKCKKKNQTKWEKNPPHTITFCKFNQEQIKMFKVLMKNKTKRNFFHAIIHYHYTQSLTKRRLRTPPRHNMFCM